MKKPLTLEQVKRPVDNKPQSAVRDSRTPLTWLHRFVPYIITGSGLFGLFASFMLAIEEVNHLKNPELPLTCDLNPIIGCGSIMDTWQGHALAGIPNQFFGIAVFAGLLAIGVSLLAGAQYKRWFWQALHGGMAAGMIFVGWFMYQSIFVLRHLCPYCIVTWVAIIPAFWYLLLYGLEQEHIVLPKKLQRMLIFARRHHADILALMFLVPLSVIIWRFWGFFSQQF